MFATLFRDAVHMHGTAEKLRPSRPSQRFEEVVSQPNAKVFVRRPYVLTAIVLSFILTNVAEAATPPLSSLDSGIVVVEASGHIPGFTQTQLTSYLALRMQSTGQM